MVISVSKLPCIDSLLFQTPENLEESYIRTVRVDEELVNIAKERIQKMIIANSFGPEK